MLREETATGRTVDEAIENACNLMGIQREECNFEILELPKTGLFGFKKLPAKVKITFEDGKAAPPPSRPAAAPSAAAHRPEQHPRPAPPPAKSEPQSAPRPNRQQRETQRQPRQQREEQAVDGQTAKLKTDAAVNYLRSVLTEMGITELSVDTEINPDGALIKVDAPNIGLVIGKRGQTMDSLQYLTSLVANKVDGGYYRITLDSGDYREKREQALIALARRIAANAAKTGRSTTLEPMNPYERRIIHATVQQVQGAVSTSIGDEPNRKVVISSANRRSVGPRAAGKGERSPRGGNDGGRPDGAPRRPRSGSRYDDIPDRGFDHAAQRHPSAGISEANTTRTQPPQEAKDKPLYGKIEFDD